MRTEADVLRAVIFDADSAFPDVEHDGPATDLDRRGDEPVRRGYLGQRGEHAAPRPRSKRRFGNFSVMASWRRS